MITGPDGGVIVDFGVKALAEAGDVAGPVGLRDSLGRWLVWLRWWHLRAQAPGRLWGARVRPANVQSHSDGTDSTAAPDQCESSCSGLFRLVNIACSLRGSRRVSLSRENTYAA